MNENSRGFRILELSAARKVQEEKNKCAYQNGVDKQTDGTERFTCSSTQTRRLGLGYLDGFLFYAK